MKRNCPTVSHLLFADDSMIFLEVDPLVCSNFKTLAACFSDASGLDINVQKSNLYFLANSSPVLKEKIKGILEMVEMEPKAKYLGLPTVWGRSKMESMSFIEDRTSGKIQGWGDSQLNHAGKKVLLKSVIQTMPVYPFMCFKAPISLCSKLNAAISKFWWRSNETGQGIHWSTWNNLNAPKGEGGLGFKDFATFNDALLAKQFWRISENPTALWAKVLKGIYFPDKNCWEARRGSSPSRIWCSLLEGRNVIQEGL